MTELEEYYNKFNEEKRLDSRHGQVEFLTSMKYIHECIALVTGQGFSADAAGEKPSCDAEEKKTSCDAAGTLPAASSRTAPLKILDIGAGTGRYSVALAEEGYDVTAIELVKYNLGILKSKNSTVKAMQGNALNLKKLADNTFDITLLFGPMYHLFGFEDKCRALSEARRVTKPGGMILVAYCMNEYGVLTYAFKEKHVLECVQENRLTEDFHTISAKENLYDYVRIEDIDAFNQTTGLKRYKIISPDGPANYMRMYLNSLSEEEFQLFINYHLSTCERMDLIGAGAHTLDMLSVPAKP